MLYHGNGMRHTPCTMAMAHIADREALSRACDGMGRHSAVHTMALTNDVPRNFCTCKHTALCMNGIAIRVVTSTGVSMCTMWRLNVHHRALCGASMDITHSCTSMCIAVAFGTLLHWLVHCFICCCIRRLTEVRVVGSASTLP